MKDRGIPASITERDMTLFRTRSTGRATLLPLTVIACVIFAAAAIGMRNVGTAPVSTGASEKATARSADAPARSTILVVNLTRFGFEPSKRIIPAGRCLVAVANRSGLQEVDLQLSRKSGERLIAEKYPRGKRHWEKLLNLTPGDYALTVVGHPEWVLNITVNPPGQ